MLYNVISNKYDNYKKNEIVVHDFKKRFTLEERKQKCKILKVSIQIEYLLFAEYHQSFQNYEIINF